jgi:hypothetical protein
MSRLAARLKLRRRLTGAQTLGDAPVKGGPVPPYPAPSGFRWAFGAEDGNRVTENGNRTIELERVA